MVGDHDAGGPGLQGLFRSADGHDALENEGLARHGRDLLQLVHGLAACRGRQPLQEGQSGGVDVHGDGAGIGGLHQVHLLPDGVQVPGLHRGHAAAVVGLQSVCGPLHDGGIGAVAGEGQDACLGAAVHQHVVVAQVVKLVAVVQGHGAYGTGHDGDDQLLAEEVVSGVGVTIFTDGVHVDAQLLPLLVAADGAGAQSLGAGAGDRIFAGKTVAHRAGAALAHAGPGLLQNFLISHFLFPPVSSG